MEILQCERGAERGTLSGPESWLLSNTRKRIVQGDTHADSERSLIGKGPPDGEKDGKGTQEYCSAMRLAISGFTVMGLVSRCLWPIILTHGPSW